MAFGQTGRRTRLRDAPRHGRRASQNFILWFTFALIAGLASAALISPFAAAVVAAAAFKVPFPRIFDRTVMVTLVAAMLLCAQPLALANLLRDGFADPRENLHMSLAGFALAMAAIGLLFLAAVAVHGAVPAGQIAGRASHYVIAAIAIALIEEGFFRAFLLGGMLRNDGKAIALLVSSAIYAIAHLVRSPARFYLTGFHPTAGLTNLAASASRIIHPGDELPMVIGLFLLGLVLGAAFILTGRIWLSAGIHAGLVLGAKTWPVVTQGGAPMPHWLAGAGPVPLIAAPAGWALAIAMLLLLPWLIRRRRDRHALAF